jgi:hypothetical protein
VVGTTAVRPAAGPGRAAVAAGLVAGLAAALLTGCAGSDRAPESGAPARSTAVAASDSEPPSPSPSTTSATQTPAASTPPAPAPPVPAETAGDLDVTDVPAPPDLGQGWSRHVDPGDAEEGVTGNGSWVRARDPREVAQGVLPLGCRRPLPPLPAPEHALEATYRGPGGAPAVALVMAFAGRAGARTFLAGAAALGRACPAPPVPTKSDEPLVTVVTQARADATTVLDRRQEHGVGAGPWVWSEAVVRRGEHVGLLAVASRPGGRLPDLDRLARGLRGSMRGSTAR